MITQGEKGQIKSLLQSPQWATVQRVADLLCDKIQNEPHSTDSEWDTAKSVLAKQGQIEGIRRLIAELFTQAQDT